MSKGIIKFFNDTKGYGFIQEEGSNKDYFVHASGLIDPVKQNDNVSFELEQSRKGPVAINVRRA